MGQIWSSGENKYKLDIEFWELSGYKQKPSDLPRDSKSRKEGKSRTESV